MGAPDRPRRARRRPAALQARLRGEECRARNAGSAGGALRLGAAQVPQGAAGAAGGRGRGGLRPRLVGRPAGRAADRGARARHAGRHDPRPGRGAGPRAAEPPALHGGEGGGQRRHGRLQARISAAGAGGRRGGAGRCFLYARRARDDLLYRPHRDRERPGAPRHRHECEGQRARAGQPRQRHRRPRVAAGGAQCRRRQAAGRGPRGFGQSRQIHLLLPRGRRGLRLAAALGEPGRGQGRLGGHALRRLRRDGRGGPGFPHARVPCGNLRGRVPGSGEPQPAQYRRGGRRLAGA